MDATLEAPDTTAPDADQAPTPGGTTVAMPTPGGTTVPMPGAAPNASQGPTPGGTTVAMPTPGGTTYPMPSGDQSPPDDGTFMGGIRHRLGGSPGQFIRNVGQRLLDAETGVGQIPVDAALQAAKAARTLDQRKGIGTGPAGHPFDGAITKMEQMMADSTPADPERAGNVDIGNKLGSILEFTGLTKLAQEIGWAKAITQYAPVEKALKNSPAIAKMAIAAMEQGAAGGAQTAIHGGSGKDVAESTGVAAVMGAGFEGAEAAGDKMRTAASNRAEAIAPSTVDIEGGKYPLLASERKGASRIAKASATIKGQPEILEARQAAVPVSLGNMVDKAIQTSLERSNTARPEIMQPTGDSQIPAATPREAVEAQLRGHQAMMGEAGFNSLDPAEQQQISDKADTLKQQLAVMPNPAADRATLAARYKGYQQTLSSDTFDTLDPAVQDSIKTKADALKQQLDTMPQPEPLSPPQQQLRDYQSLADDPSFAQRSPEFQKRITSQITALKSQLDEGNGFAPHDIEAVMKKANGDVGLAGQALRDEHIPVYEAIDAANKGQFNELDQHGKDLRTAMSNVTNVEDIPKIRAAIRENDAKIDAMFEADNPTIPRNVRTQARLGYKDGSALLDLDSILKAHAYNGVTAAEHADPNSILQREFSGGASLNRKLQNLIEDRPDELTQMLGPNGITNIKQMGTLLSTPSTAYEAQGLMGMVAKAFRSQKGRNKSMASAAAFGPGHALSVAGLHGAGATVEGAQHYYLQRMATDPDFNARVQYAVKNKVQTSISVPLLTGTLLNWMNGNPTTQDQQVVAPDATRGVQGVTLPVLKENK